MIDAPTNPVTNALPTRLPDSDLAVATRGLTRSFGKQIALRDVALEVPVGSVYLLVGPNGAGKSTMIKLLLDLIRADSGAAEVFGLPVQEHGPQVRANIGYVPEYTSWGYGWMNVARLLQHHARYFPTWDSDYAARLASVFELRMDRRMGTLSKGQARRVHLTMALAHRPPLLLLDEPTDGLDPLMRDETLGVLADHLAETETTVVVSTHHVEEVERLADHIGVLSNGELRAQLPITVLQRGLRRYRGEVPDGWRGVESLNGQVLRRVAGKREIEWTVWGPEQEITRELERSGATLREAAPVSLPDATLALLNQKG